MQNRPKKSKQSSAYPFAERETFVLTEQAMGPKVLKPPVKPRPVEGS
jgi:hypothetical protein